MFHFAYFVSLQGMDEVSSCLQGSDHECELNNWNFPPFTPRKCHLPSNVENNLSSTQCGQGQFHFPGSGPPPHPNHSSTRGLHCLVSADLSAYILRGQESRGGEPAGCASSEFRCFLSVRCLTWFSFKLCENIRILQGTNYLPLK